MKGKRYSYGTLPPQWRDCDAWPSVDVSQCSDEDQARFKRMSLGLRQYLSTGKLGAAAKEAGCSGTVLIDQLNRCVQQSDDGSIVGWLGLVAYTRVKAYERTAPLPKDQAIGSAGSFATFLEANEPIREKLHALIRAGGGKGSAKSGSPSIKGVFKQFRKYCINVCKMSESDYPFCSESQGRRSVERYAWTFVTADTVATKTWLGADASARRKLGTGKHSFPLGGRPADVCAIDAHRFHCTGTVVINGLAGPQPVPIDRLSMYLCADEAMRCITGYAVSIAKEPSSSTLVDSLLMGMRPWSRKELKTPGLAYMPGAALPVGHIPGLNAYRPCVIKFDNAAQHYAIRATEGARRTFGCALTFGPIGGWWRNAVVERLFKTLEQYGIQRLPSSTGSNAADPRRPNSARQAVKHWITFDELIELLDVLAANYNATTAPALGGMTPLAAMAMHLCEHPRPLVPRLEVPATANTPRLGIVTVIKTVAGCAKPGKVRSPYVELDKVRYSGKDLCARFDLLGTQLILHVDERDMRTVKAFLFSGECLGELTVLSKAWNRTAHSRDMRREINRLLSNHSIEAGAPDYVLAYMEELARRARRDAAKHPYKISAAATKLAQVAHHTGLPTAGLPSSEKPSQTPRVPPIRPRPAHIKPPSWGSR